MTSQQEPMTAPGTAAEDPTTVSKTPPTVVPPGTLPGTVKGRLLRLRALPPWGKRPGFGPPRRRGEY